MTDTPAAPRFAATYETLNELQRLRRNASPGEWGPHQSLRLPPWTPSPMGSVRLGTVANTEPLAELEGAFHDAVANGRAVVALMNRCDQLAEVVRAAARHIAVHLTAEEEMHACDGSGDECGCDAAIENRERTRRDLITALNEFDRHATAHPLPRPRE